MRIAILMANTDESAFAQRHPKDGEKFTALLAKARPDWTYTSYNVKDGIFPKDLADFDGALITGSPASVRDNALWIPLLEAVVQQMHDKAMPLFGTCFGHQLIAQALGGRVGDNPDGFRLGATVTELRGTPVAVYAAHQEQVVTPPPGAEIIAVTPGCAHAGFAIGHQIETTQYHPEMSRAFFTALVDAFAPALGDTVTARARDSLTTPVDMDAWATRIAQFFETAHAARQGEA
ncbi:MAG: type 1 glutamine amidotransferase [Pseudomonadota bacterium]